jgi:hypothetical protein
VIRLYEAALKKIPGVSGARITVTDSVLGDELQTVYARALVDGVIFSISKVGESAPVQEAYDELAKAIRNRNLRRRRKS